MLKSIYIKNYALIDDVNINFKNGFTAITGETGAGKSILLGALSLLLGKRADYGILREETQKCIVEGIFSLEKLRVDSFFAENDIDYNDNTLIRREIIPSGRSRAFINDTPVKLELLKTLGEKLINIHSQNETLEIGKSLFQLQVLDNFIDKPKLFIEYSNLYNDFVQLRKKLNALILENEQSQRDEDYYRFQFEELKGLNLMEGEDEKLIEREKLLSHAEEFMQGISHVKGLLTESDKTIIDELSEVQDWLLRISKFHTGVDRLLQRINSARIELEDISDEVDRIDSLSEVNPDELQTITDRLNAIYKLQQKHQVSNVNELLQVQKDFEEKLNNLDLSDELVKQVKANLSSAEENARKIASQIHQQRKKEAFQFAESVEKLLNKLGMKEAAFEVVVENTGELNQYGTDKVSFLFNANAGGRPQELNNVASGGEMSRLMLAIKSLVTKEQLLPTVIFDEIDSGVSGEIAGKVGNIIKSMSEHHQIIAITHLPQIAAKSDEHFKVFKMLENGVTKSQIAILDKVSRIEEIAKLLSDENVSESAVNTAKELLKV